MKYPNADGCVHINPRKSARLSYGRRSSEQEVQEYHELQPADGADRGSAMPISCQRVAI